MDSETDLKNEFAEFDADGDGRIDRGEFRALLTRLGLRRSGPIMEDVFSSVDANHDGYISYAEFQAWWRAETR
ncbi:MAG: EF-hand domain-containing protein [Xanthomonadales bacterium]|nr:EF-hand domain-containing protein [Xanthomonadales bacterium]